MILEKVPYLTPTDFSKMKPYYIGSYINTTDLYSAIDTFVITMDAYDAMDIYFDCSASPFYDSSAGGTFYGRVFKYTNTSYCITGANPRSSNIPPMIIWRWSGGWAVRKFTVTA